MKKIILPILFSIIAIISGAQIIVSGEITTNTTWTNDNIYLLHGWLYVRDGATLTIEPGTLIKGDYTTKGTLIVERGARLIADGTAEQPIVFTSQKPAGQRSYGDWGGVILCGKASINAPANAGSGTQAGEAIIEGGVGSLYGGGLNPDDNDDSGILRYVRIEFGGIPFQPNSEINGLTMGGVGRGTVIDYVQVSYSGDDAIEWFGGTVNCKHLVCYNNWDDDFDSDFGYRGNIQFGLAIRDPNIADQSGSNGFESDNDGQGTANTPITRPIFSNISIIGPLTFNSTINSNYKRALHIRRNAQTSIFNSVFVGYPTGLLIDGSTTQANAANNDLRFKNSVLCYMNDSIATSTSANPNNVSGTFDIDSWYNSPSISNTLVNHYSELQFRNVNNSQPDFSLLSNSPLMSGSSFSDSYLDNSFFTPTSFRGAIGTDNWTACWAEFDPQNAEYISAINNTVTASIDADGSTTVCPGATVTLTANSNITNGIYQWSNGTTASSTTVAAPTNISLIISNQKGCVSNTVVLPIHTFPAPFISIESAGPTSFCTGGSVTLTSDQSSGNIWSNNQYTSSIVVSESGTYVVTFTDNNGCQAISNSIEVSVSDSPAPTVAIDGSTTICDGESVTLTASNSETYQWSLNNAILLDANSQTLDAVASGAYSVSVTNTNQCDGTGSSGFVFVQVNPSPAAAFEYEAEFGSANYTFNNTSTNSTSYHWNFGDGTTSNEVNPDHTFNIGGSHTITLTATNGNCIDVYALELTGVGVGEIVGQHEISLFPNPTKEDATLQMTFVNAADAQLMVYDLTGKVLFQHSIRNGFGVVQVAIPSSTFEAGIYILQIQSEREKQTLRLAVNH